uniref:Golgi integral membrane protein 4 n=1 Tax=Sphenodon punctatus TaxID=8508 RepID=A0A8D0HDK1_SPHPU
MGTGICTRRQKGLLQTGFCLVAVACLGSGVFMYNHLQQKVRNSEALALKYKQQQEALSAQLQVVYEHRSRLERSLQKERGEHKKTKEDFLVYKLEAQEALNKEKVGTECSRNQHEDVKKQLLDLQLQHNGLKLEHRKMLETHGQKYSQLQREKENEITGLQDTVYKLREESKLLRKAHQDVHTQLVSAQAQMEEFRQLKEALAKMPSFKETGVAKGQQQPQALKEQPLGLGNSQSQLARQKVPSNLVKMPPNPLEQEKHPGGNPLAAAQVSGIRSQGEGTLPQGQSSHSNDGPNPQGNVPLGPLAPLQDANPPPAAMPVWPQQGHGAVHMIRFTRTVNSVQNGNQVSLVHSAICSWQDIVNKVNAQMGEEQVHNYPQSLSFNTRPKKETQNGNHLLANQQREVEHRITNPEEGKDGTDDEELEMGMGLLSASLAQLPDDAADPAQDPNNQGEDEFEEAELERPDFEEKAAGSDKPQKPNAPGKGEVKGKPWQLSSVMKRQQQGSSGLGKNVADIESFMQGCYLNFIRHPNNFSSISSQL